MYAKKRYSDTAASNRDPHAFVSFAGLFCIRVLSIVNYLGKVVLQNAGAGTRVLSDVLDVTKVKNSSKLGNYVIFSRVGLDAARSDGIEYRESSMLHMKRLTTLTNPLRGK